MVEHSAFQRRGALERGAASDVWRNTLTQIPSIFGRLVYLAGLIDPNSGQYRHHGLAHYFNEEEADAALQPVKAGSGSVELPGMNRNRRGNPQGPQLRVLAAAGCRPGALTGLDHGLTS